MQSKTYVEMANTTISQTDVSSSITYSIQIFMCIIALFVYGAGVYLHIQVIKVTRKEKQMTSKLDETNSIFFIVHYAHVMIMHGITYLVDDLYLYLGKWFCYISKTITIFGNFHTIQHSFIIAVMKYTMIVHYQTLSDPKKNRVKSRFFYTNLFYSVIMIAFLSLLRPDFIVIYDGVSQANRCLGKPEVRSGQGLNATTIKMHHICNLPEPLHLFSFEYIMYVLQKSVCWINIIIIYANTVNMIEMIIYCRIFAFMRR